MGWIRRPDGDGTLLPEYEALYKESALARERAAELASSATAPPAEATGALVDVGAQPTSPENLASAVAQASAQPKPARAAGLSRSPLPGDDLSP